MIENITDENEDMIQTGIQASPIQALPIIFLGSSYRKRTWIFYPIHLNPCKICVIFSPHLFSHQSPHHRGSSSALACNSPSMNLRPISKPNHWNEDLLMMTIQSVTFDPALSIACCHLEMGITCVLNFISGGVSGHSTWSTEEHLPSYPDFNSNLQIIHIL